jgi:ABC-type sugar transport system ATPase subunit
LSPEVERLFELIGRLKAQGRGIVYITHKMEEIERIANRITVLRDGRLVGTVPARELSAAELVRWMVGRETVGWVEPQAVERRAPPRAAEEKGSRGAGETRFRRENGSPPLPCSSAPLLPCSPSPPLSPRPLRLRIERFTVRAGRRGRPPAVENVTLHVRQGEIVGLAGLEGSGASELLMGLFGGFGKRAEGEVWLDEQPARIGSPREAIRRGIGLVTSDRKATGLVLSMSITANATLAALPRLSPAGWRRPRRERETTLALARALELHAASSGMEVGQLSGGNQQKVALGKWIAIEPRILLLDEPTRGVDIGAKQEIYAGIRRWTSEGLAIILRTSEMPELLALSDRIVVLHRGRVAAQFSRAEATPAGVLEAAMGGRG